MYAKKLLVHDRRERQGAEGFHACLVDLLRVFMLTFELECEIVRQMSALVVTSQQP